MTIAATIPVANMAAANAELEAKGFGPRNFSIPAYTGTAPTHACLHCGGRVADASGNEEYPGTHNFIATIKALPNVTVYDPSDLPPPADPENPEPVAQGPAERVQATLPAGAQWAKTKQPLEGQITAGGLYYTLDGEVETLWWAIQSYDSAVWPDPTVIPALIRRAKVPGQVEPWVQPIDQFDAYKLVNPFTGQPDRVTHNGQTWEVTQADGAGNNVWEPGVFGWTQV